MIIYTIKKNLAVFFSNIQMRIITATVGLVFIAVLISVYINFNHTQRLLEYDTSRLILTNLEQMGNRIENTCLDMLKLSNVLRLDNTLFTNLNTDQEGDGFTGLKSTQDLSAEDLIRTSAIERQLGYAKSNFFFNYKVDTLAFSRDGLMITNMDSLAGGQQRFITNDFGNKILNEKRMELLKNNNEYFIWTVPYSYANGTTKEEKFLSLATQIKSTYSSRVIGIIIINSSLENFSDIFKGNTGSSIFLMDKDGLVIQSNGKKNLSGDELDEIKIQTGQKGFYTRFSEGKREIVNYYRLNRLGWSIVSITPYDYMMEETNSLRNRIIFVNIVTFGVSILLSVISIIYFTTPLKRLIKDLKKKKIGVYSLGDNSKTYSNDVNGIVKSFDHMFKRIDELVARVIEDQKIEHDLRYETLKAQINPHFLFNTLNTIKWSAMMSGAANVSNMIADLGMLLEVSMNKGPEEISIEKEIELVKAYVNIQNYRYDNRIELDISIEPELYSYKIVKLLLQPIIENAFIHGFKNYRGNCRIEIKGALENKNVKIDVLNNGNIIPEEKISEILDSSEGEGGQKQKFSGIGLKNIHERLKYKYGDGYGLAGIISEGGHTVISIIFPAEKTVEEGIE